MLPQEGSLLDADHPGNGVLIARRSTMGGGVSERFGALESGIIESRSESAIPAFRDTPVRKAAVGTDPGPLGAASLVFEPA